MLKFIVILSSFNRFKNSKTFGLQNFYLVMHGNPSYIFLIFSYSYIFLYESSLFFINECFNDFFMIEK